jgi:hypothetical protein
MTQSQKLFKQEEDLCTIRLGGGVKLQQVYTIRLGGGVKLQQVYTIRWGGGCLGTDTVDDRKTLL